MRFCGLVTDLGQNSQLLKERHVSCVNLVILKCVKIIYEPRVIVGDNSPYTIIIEQILSENA